MFDRIEYKRKAWNLFKKRLGVPLIASLLFSVLGFLAGIFGFTLIKLNKTWLSPFIVLFIIFGLGICLVVISYISLKMTRTQDKLPMNDIFIGIKYYWQDGILAILWESLWIFLWSLLFTIPGIIKMISYSMMYFVIVENPGISVTKAMDISKILTNGHKTDLFVMQLSFLGWAILCYFTGGIGYVFLTAYMSLANANAYNALKQMAFQEGKLVPADFSTQA